MRPGGELGSAGAALWETVAHTGSASMAKPQPTPLPSSQVSKPVLSLTPVPGTEPVLGMETGPRHSLPSGSSA